MVQTTVKKTNYLEKRRPGVSWLSACSVLVTFSYCFVKVISYVYDVVRSDRAFNHITEQDASCCVAL